MIKLLDHVGTIILMLLCIKFETSLGETARNVQNVLENVFSSSVYNKEIIGKEDLTEALEVNLSFSLVYIKRLDEIEERIDSFGVLFLGWKDERLVWDPKIYNDTYKVWMAANKVWRPEVTLENPSTSHNFYGDITRLKSFHMFNGEASLVIGDMFECTCSIDLTSFPWDRQTCEINFIVWGYADSEVRLVGSQKEIDTKAYHTNGIWELVSTKVYPKPEPMKSVLTFEMVLQRRPTFFVVNILLPITTLSVLQLFVFKVPIDSGERISFSLTVLLSISVYMTLVSGSLPPGAESMASLCYLLVFIMVESALICLCNIVSVSLYHKHIENYEVRSFWYTFLNVFKKRKCCRRHGKVDNKSELQSDDGHKNQGSESNIEISKTVKERQITWKDVSYTFDWFMAILMTILLCFSFLMYAYYVITG